MLTVALGQIATQPGNPAQNAASMLSMIENAKKSGAHMIIFPELAIPGYLLGDMWEQSAFLRECEYFANLIIQAADDIIVLFGNVAIDWEKKNEDGRPRKYNAFFAAYRQKLWGDNNFPYPFRIKTLMPNYREFEDSRHFFCLRKLACEENLSLPDLFQPIQLPWQNQTLSVACLICEDGWDSDYTIKPLPFTCASAPVDLIVNISSSPFTMGKNNKRNRIFSAQAQTAAAPLIYVNNAGIQNNGKTIYAFDGSSTVYAPDGRIITYSQPFEEDLTVQALPLGQSFSTIPEIDAPNDFDPEYIYKALSYGIRQFASSLGIQRVVIGSSGGIDSAVSAALYCDALGPENVLLVNMPSRFNSATTQDLSAQLARNLKTRYAIVPIEDSVALTTGQLESLCLTNTADGTEEKLTVSSFVKENIQARDRSSRILSAIAAAWNGVFTCNANKAELSVGYATLYGDQAGFLAALADLWKHQVYDLGRYLNEKIFHTSVIPEEIFTLPPSAELSLDHAVDEGKGDPLIYPYHDFLFRSFIERWDKATPEDILLWYSQDRLEKEIGCAPGLVVRIFPSPDLFIADLERWWKLYSGMAVAKRIQAPPIFAVSRRAYGLDHRESQIPPYFTQEYTRLKTQILSNA